MAQFNTEHPADLEQGTPVRCNGYVGAIVRHYDGNTYEIRLPGGIVATDDFEVIGPDGYQKGAVLESSWGYDQTNVDFYLIEKRSGDWLWLTPLNCRIVENDHHNMRGSSMPGEPKAVGDDELAYKFGRYTGKPFRRRLAFRDGKAIGCSIKHGWASLWDGAPVQWTAYA